MKKLIAIVLGLGVAATVAVDGSAQTTAPSVTKGDAPKVGDPPKHTDRRPDADRDRANRPEWKPDANSIEGKRLVGVNVRTPDGSRIGEIDQIIVSMTDGRITHAVIGVGGVAGIGERKLVVPWNKVKLSRHAQRGDEMVATVDQSTIDGAQQFTRAGAEPGDRAPAASPGTAPARERDRAPDGKKQ